MSDQSADESVPALVIIAGPNGSGKSSAYNNTKIQEGKRDFWIINPDLLTSRLSDTESLEIRDANLQSVKRIERWLYASVDVHQTIGVETVLSTPKYQKLVEHAKRRGFEIWLIYVVLESPELNVERVKIRVRKGGHDVPTEKIVDRYHRSLQQFPWFLEKADKAWVYDNSSSEPRLIAHKESDKITVDPDAIPAVIAAIKTMQSK